MANAIQVPKIIAPRITMVNVTYVKKKGPSLKPGILAICAMAGTLSGSPSKDGHETRRGAPVNYSKLTAHRDISSQSIDAKMSAPGASVAATKVNS